MRDEDQARYEWLLEHFRKHNEHSQNSTQAVWIVSLMVNKKIEDVKQAIDVAMQGEIK